MALQPKNNREHVLALYGHIKGHKRDLHHMHETIHELGGKIDKVYWVLLLTVGAVAFELLNKYVF